MSLQLAELKAPPVDVKDALYGPGSALGTAIGESPAEAASRIEEAKKNANDLTGLVRHKKKPAVSTFRKCFHDFSSGINVCLLMRHSLISISLLLRQ
jgi:hypothetical protein